MSHAEEGKSEQAPVPVVPRAPQPSLAEKPSQRYQATLRLIRSRLEDEIRTSRKRRPSS